MNEEVLQDLFNRAVSKGYNKSIEEFTVLLSQNNDVLIDNFNYVKGKGYKKTIEDFKTLTGVVEGVNTTDSEVKKKTNPFLLLQRKVWMEVHRSWKNLAHWSLPFKRMRL